MSTTCFCFEFFLGAGVGTTVGVYKSEHLMPVYEQIIAKSKEYYALMKEKVQEFRESQQIDAEKYK
ncbi:unnamed protein product [Amoebophrya sp. A25]|nr:unnamed protein product [Amoebophrya sp. A25]|eukprot:GSA25T00006815001.1